MEINIDALIEKQFEKSIHFKNVFENIENVKTRKIEFDNFYYVLQFNPCRIGSATADTTKKVSSNDCFLCEGHRFENQIGLEYNSNYDIFVNPFPIFKRHLTIVDKHHVEQEILGQEDVMIEMAESLPGFTVFYNSRHSGASAPFHRHFQACPACELPVFAQWDTLFDDKGKDVKKLSEQCVLKYDGTRYFFMIQTSGSLSAGANLKNILLRLKEVCKTVSPEANVGVTADGGVYKIVVFPRCKHRPEEYFATGERHLTISPGFADMAGIIPCAVEEDYLKLTKDMIISVFNQVTLNVKTI